MTICMWPYDEDRLPQSWEDLSPTQQDYAVTLASATLRRLTGGRVGHCAITLRPCKPRDAYMVGAGYHFYWDRNFNPTIHDGAWINSCGCHTPCGHAAICEVDLPGPVGRIDSVVVGPDTVDPADYRIDNGHLLVWQGAGDCPFPTSQDMTKPLGAEGTFGVTYLNAYPVDVLGQGAVALLAAEFAKAILGDTKCKLPSGVTTLVRQGVTMQLVTGAFPDGNTGLREVDTWIALWNPNKLQRPATVWSPDMPSHRTTRSSS